MSLSGVGRSHRSASQEEEYQRRCHGDLPGPMTIGVGRQERGVRQARVTVACHRHPSPQQTAKVRVRRVFVVEMWCRWADDGQPSRLWTHRQRYYQGFFWSGRRDSNPRPSPWQCNGIRPDSICYVQGVLFCPRNRPLRPPCVALSYTGLPTRDCARYLRPGAGCAVRSRSDGRAGGGATHAKPRN